MPSGDVEGSNAQHGDGCDGQHRAAETNDRRDARCEGGGTQSIFYQAFASREATGESSDSVRR